MSHRAKLPANHRTQAQQTITAPQSLRNYSTYDGTTNTSSKNLIDRVTFNPQQCSGRFCIRGMRIRVSDVIDLLASDATREEILADYPYLESDGCV